MSEVLLSTFVPGIPKTSGSKRGFAFKDKQGRLRANVVPANKQGQRDWQADVKQFALDHRKEAGEYPVRGPVCLRLNFVLPRPKAHYGSGRNAGVLKDWAKDLPHTKTPDLTKLTRAVEDALLGVIYKDDSQVVEKIESKAYGDATGVHILAVI